VTPDEFDDPDDLEIGCSAGGEQLQKARTSDMVFTVSQLVEYLSSVVTLFPGDVIFTGTPAGVGFARSPQRYLRAGEELVTTIEGIGELRNPLVSP
jgi:2,4-didehydro-3-deoxy-L-rhamnonate hydrolase